MLRLFFIACVMAFLFVPAPAFGWGGAHGVPYGGYGHLTSARDVSNYVQRASGGVGVATMGSRAYGYDPYALPGVGSAFNPISPPVENGGGAVGVGGLPGWTTIPPAPSTNIPGYYGPVTSPGFYNSGLKYKSLW